MIDPILTPVEWLAIREFIDGVQEQFGEALCGVILYGSKARNEAEPESDLDLLVILTGVDWQVKHQISDVASHISVEHDLLLLPHTFSLSNWQDMVEFPYPFFSEVFKDGVPVYGDAAIFAPLAHRDVTPLYDLMTTPRP